MQSQRPAGTVASGQNTQVLHSSNEEKAQQLSKRSARCIDYHDISRSRPGTRQLRKNLTTWALESCRRSADQAWTKVYGTQASLHAR